MLFSRFLPIIAPLALAARLAAKKPTPVNVGTLRTDQWTFGFVLLGTVLLVGALFSSRRPRWVRSRSTWGRCRLEVKCLFRESGCSAAFPAAYPISEKEVRRRICKPLRNKLAK